MNFAGPCSNRTVSEADEFCIKNEELCIKNEDCVVFQMMTFAGLSVRGTGGEHTPIGADGE